MLARCLVRQPWPVASCTRAPLLHILNLEACLLSCASTWLTSACRIYSHCMLVTAFMYVLQSIQAVLLSGLYHVTAGSTSALLPSMSVSPGHVGQDQHR